MVLPLWVLSVQARELRELLLRLVLLAIRMQLLSGREPPAWKMLPVWVISAKVV